MIPRIAVCMVLWGLSLHAWSAAPLATTLQPNPRRLNPPPGVPVPMELREEWLGEVNRLGQRIEKLRTELAGRDNLLRLLPDVEVFHKAVRFALEDDIFTSTNQFGSARRLLAEGFKRAEQLAAGRTPWNTKAGLLEWKKDWENKPGNAKAGSITHVPVVRGYRSRIDGSIQPYGVMVPVGYLLGDDHPRRLDFWLHGRGDTLNEMAFIEGRQRPGGEFLPEETFVLHPYGRFMNAFKFAGETDVFESLENAALHYPIDRRRLSMRGFSMGGAGAWHLGAHHPDQFASVNPGAGFVDVLNYQKLAPRLSTVPWWEQKLWNLYDPLACPINLMNTSLIAYSGEIDAQKAAADLMEAALQKEGRAMVHIVGPKTGHAYEPAARKEVANRVDEATHAGILSAPQSLSWVTHTLQFNRAHWLTLDALEEHWKEARVDALVESEGQGVRIKLTTRNVRAMSLSLAPAAWAKNGAHLVVDGQDLGFRRAVFSNPPPGQLASWWSFSLTRREDGWKEAQSSEAGLAKKHGLQGPIDHAFMDSFLMVRPTGPGLTPGLDAWVKRELEDATFHWRRFFRGEARVKEDRQITDEDIRKHHLVLWGDPSSNKLLGKILDRLPLRWSSDALAIGTRHYDVTRQVPVLIYPNPLNPDRYIVINTGFTFPQYAIDSNSLQTPQLPDWAILDREVPLAERIRGKGVIDADFFGEGWEVKAKRPSDR